MSWLNGKNMRNRFAKNTCKTSIKECPDSVISEGNEGLRYARFKRYVL